MSRDPRDVVREGYDALAPHYLEFRTRKPGAELELLDKALAGVPDGAQVLDAGCGAGLPVAARLAKRFTVTGIDISPVQVGLAREIVPSARFVVGDMSAPDLAAASFDALVCLFALFHLPRQDHAAALTGFARLLRPGGVLFLSVGNSDHAGYIEEDRIGSGEALYWSHFDREANARLVREAGFEIDWERLISEDEEFGGASHPFIRAHRL